MQVHEEKRHGIKTEHENCGSVLGPPSEVGETGEEFRRRVKRSGAEKRQAQAKDVEGENTLSP